MADILVSGHKNPDTDTIVSAIVYARIMGYTPVRLGELNAETKYALEYFGVAEPGLLSDAAGKQMILVDHNEFSQAANGIEQAQILEIIDHHRLNFSYSLPIKIICEPLVSTSSVIFKYWKEKITDKQLAGLLLCGLLSDSVVFKSPTTTEYDKQIASELGKLAGVADIEQFGFELKKKNASLAGKSVAEIVNGDFKEFLMGEKKVGIGQVELPELSEVQQKKQEIKSYLQELLTKNNYALALFAAVDFLQEGSLMLFAGDKTIMERAFNVKIETDEVYLPGVMSRKKQIVPPLENVLKT